MVDVILYSRDDCHLCELVVNELDKLRGEIPHQLSIINIDEVPELLTKFGLIVPVVEIGPYQLKSPIDPKDLKITLMAAQHSEEENELIDKAIKNGTLKLNVSWTASDRFSYWLSRRYLGLFNLFVLTYLFFPIMAPMLMKAGIEKPAIWIYKAYGLVCHQLAFRSWFIYGEQAAYPREAADVEIIMPYSEATGLDESDLWAARTYTGDELVGYKIALCQRDVAIYGGILIFGLVFGASRKKIRSIPWYIWIVFGVLPIGLDGVSQLISQPPINLLPIRESTPILRSLTGFLFGFMTAWFGYPLVEESMNDTKDYLVGKLDRINRQ
jgi:uncharacterized membrane protein